ncbi:MAG: septal ring lytic transglycosylase RlpA family protein [Xanthobacteraceae bacterium]|jgi:peptidoglycan lytic transglycosylase
MRGRASSAVGRFAPVAACAALCFFLANCTNNSHIDPRYGVEPSARLVEPGASVPKGGGVYRVGSPYTVAGRVYIPQDNPHYRADGVASWYGSDFHGRSTANGEIFDAEGITAAHPTLPLPSYVRVSNLSNGRSLIVRVNDRGPYAGNRIIDVSKRAAYLLGFTVSGTAWVRVEYVGTAPVEGSDDRVLEATLRQDEPAPAPGTTRLAALRIVPASMTAVPRTRLASVATTASLPASATLTYATAISPTDGGSDEFLTGRGLY